MDTIIFEYVFLWVLILLAFFSFLIGVHKMLQVIVSTSFVILILLWWSGFLNYLTNMISQSPNITLFSFSNMDLVSFIQSADTTTSIFIFIGLMVYVVHYTKHNLNIVSPFFQSKLAQVALAPLAILSMVLCLSVAVFGTDIFSLSFLQQAAIAFSTHSFVYYFVFFLPLWLLLQGFITLIILFEREKTISHSPISYDDL